MLYRLVGWLEFNVQFQHKCGYIRDEDALSIAVISAEEDRVANIAEMNITKTTKSMYECSYLASII